MYFRHTACGIIFERSLEDGEPSGLCSVCGRCWDCTRLPTGDDHSEDGAFYCPYDEEVLDGIDYLVSTGEEYAYHGIGKGIHHLVLEAGGVLDAVNEYSLSTVFPTIRVRIVVQYDWETIVDHVALDTATVALFETVEGQDIVWWERQELDCDAIESFLSDLTILQGTWEY